MARYARFDSYEIHGLGFDSLWMGLDAIGMPHHRRQAAVDAVRAIIAAEAVSGFCWYKVPNTDELAAYWDGGDKNMLWIEPGNVHVDKSVAFPLTVTGLKGGDQPMHHLPGAIPGAGGKRAATSAAAPLPCQVCMNPHGPDEECY
jgi:hypothetical protein